jgi:predicted dehydrogenase
MNAEDQIALSGRLQNGAVASVHFRGGSSRATNFLWEINGTAGDLLVALDSPPVIQFARATLRGGRGDERTVSELPVPSTYERVAALAGRRQEMPYNLAHAYAQLFSDLSEGIQLAFDFVHAVRLHHLLDRIQNSDEADGLPNRGRSSATRR